jgi:hypothetical protein
MLNVICVLWQGDFRGRDYSVKDVVRLHKQVTYWLKARPYKFWVMTNAEDVPFPTLPFEHGLSGWWTKLELFREGLPFAGQRALYLDLDTIVCGGLDEVAFYDASLAFMGNGTSRVHEDREGHRLVPGLQSSVIAWDVGRHILDVEKIKRENFMDGLRGDQDVFSLVFKDRVKTFPAQWFKKLRLCYNEGPDANTRIILGHPKRAFRRALADNQWVRGLMEVAHA